MSNFIFDLENLNNEKYVWEVLNDIKLELVNFTSSESSSMLAKAIFMHGAIEAVSVILIGTNILENDEKQKFFEDILDICKLCLKQNGSYHECPSHLFN